MHPIVDNFLERPLSHKIAVWAGSLVLIAILFWLYGLKQPHAEHVELSEKIERLEVELYKQQQMAKRLPAIQQEVKVLDRKLELLLLQLPDSKELDELLAQVSTLAVDTGLEVLKFAPAREIIKEFFAEVPVSVELEGTFHELATFFDEVGNLSRIVNIGSISVDILKETPAEVLIRATCTVTAFRYLDESERVQNKPAEPTTGRKRRQVT